MSGRNVKTALAVNPPAAIMLKVHLEALVMIKLGFETRKPVLSHRVVLADLVVAHRLGDARCQHTESVSRSTARCLNSAVYSLARSGWVRLPLTCLIQTY